MKRALFIAAIALLCTCNVAHAQSSSNYSEAGDARENYLRSMIGTLARIEITRIIDDHGELPAVSAEGETRSAIIDRYVYRCRASVEIFLLTQEDPATVQQITRLSETTREACERAMLRRSR